MCRRLCVWILLAVVLYLAGTWDVGFAQATPEQGFVIVKSETAKLMAGTKFVAEVRKGPALA